MFFHTTCMDFPYVYVSAGVRGLQIKVAPADLVDFTKSSVCDLVAE